MREKVLPFNIDIKNMKLEDNIVLRYYIFDWDDNIMHMDTKIVMEKLHDGIWTEIEVSTSDFATVRSDKNYRIPLDNDGNPNYDKAYSNFRDKEGNEQVFLNDTIDAISNKKFGKSYNAFKKCLVDGNLFFILTARGNEPDTIRRCIEYIIESQLSRLEKNTMLRNLNFYRKLFGTPDASNKEVLDEYLSLCEYIGVSSNSFINSVCDSEIPENVEFTPQNTELSKKIAIKRLTDKCVDISKIVDNVVDRIEIGFSDDDMKNVNSVADVFKNNLKKKYPHVEFSLYNTSKNDDGTINYIQTKY